jgi:hypothetical protein
LERGIARAGRRDEPDQYQESKMDAQNGESRAGEARLSNGDGLGGMESGCGGRNPWGNIRPLGRIVQPPPRENPTPPLKFEPGQVPYTLDSRHPGSMLSLRAHLKKSIGRVPRSAKLIRIGGEKAEHRDDGWMHWSVGLDVSEPERLLNTIRYLLDKPHVHVVHGALSDDVLAALDYEACPARMRRIQQDKFDYGKEWKATIIDAKKIWLAIDFEHLPIPLGVHGLKNIAENARARLPEEFHKAWCTVVATASYNVDPKYVHLRFWFWLDKPLSCKEKTRWLDKNPFIDMSLYKSCHQPIFTAGPMFEGDPVLDDPMLGADRIITLDGDACVVTPHAERLKTPPRPPYHAPLRGTLRGDGSAMLSAACRTIRDAPQDMPRHVMIFNQCRDIARLVAVGYLDEEYALLRITRAAADIGKTDEDEIKRIFNDTLRYRREHMRMESGDNRVFDENDWEIRS